MQKEQQAYPTRSARAWEELSLGEKVSLLSDAAFVFEPVLTSGLWGFEERLDQ